jgi:hypothetical protein
MPTYMDEHRVEGVKADDVAKAHAADVAIQDKHGVNYRNYWVDEAGGRIWCLVDAPDKEAATRVHQEAHGLVAHDLHEVKEG